MQESWDPANKHEGLAPSHPVPKNHGYIFEAESQQPLQGSAVDGPKIFQWVKTQVSLETVPWRLTKILSIIYSTKIYRYTGSIVKHNTYLQLISCIATILILAAVGCGYPTVYFLPLFPINTCVRRLTDSDPWTTSGSAPTASPCQVCRHRVTRKRRKKIWQTRHDTAGLRGQSMASLLIERYPPVKALSSSLWTPSVSLFVKGQIHPHGRVHSFLSPSC